MALRRLPLIAAAALAGCSGGVIPPGRQPAPAPVAPAPAPTPTPAAAPLAEDWRDWPVTPGNWIYRRDGRGSIALFGRTGADADFTIRCDLAAQRVYLSRQGMAQAGAAMTIRTSSLTRTLASRPTGGTPPYVAAALTPQDSLLDAMGFSRGRFIIQQAGLPMLVIPAWAEILRVTEDCRR